MINGMLNVYKEKGFTSHDVVAKLRGILKQKKIGHTGTLDPQAEGVLPVCLGKATKLCDMLIDRDKTYQATMRLGLTTDTQDITGQAQNERQVCCDEQQIREALASFIGPYQQIPPMYSAIKVNGRKLYELAREGVEIERKARSVEIYQINLQSIELPFVTFEVSCSKGTYIRTLCQDVGEKLGCGACMEALIRTKASCFELSDALKLTEIEKLFTDHQLSSHLVEIDSMFSSLEKAMIKQTHQKLIENGNPFSAACCQSRPGARRIRVYDAEGAFVGVYYWREEKELYYPEKLFFC